MLEKTLESPLDCHSILKEISPEYLFIGRADAEAETPKFWPPEGKSGFIRKGPDAGKD